LDTSRCFCWYINDIFGESALRGDQGTCSVFKPGFKGSFNPTLDY
jgi:hypothetical protein